jgi:hypothetical protein
VPGIEPRPLDLQPETLTTGPQRRSAGFNNSDQKHGIQITPCGTRYRNFEAVPVPISVPILASFTIILYYSLVAMARAMFVLNILEHVPHWDLSRWRAEGRRPQHDNSKFAGARCSVLVKALCYNPEGRGFGTRWGEFLQFTKKIIFLGSKVRPLRKADNLTTIWEQIL